MPRSTVSAILARIGLGKLSALERPEPPNRYERRRPGELLHIDVKKLAGIDRAGHRVTGSRRGQAAGVGWEYVYAASTMQPDLPTSRCSPMSVRSPLSASSDERSPNFGSGEH